MAFCDMGFEMSGNATLLVCDDAPTASATWPLAIHNALPECVIWAPSSIHRTQPHCGVRTCSCITRRQSGGGAGSRMEIGASMCMRICGRKANGAGIGSKLHSLPASGPECLCFAMHLHLTYDLPARLGSVHRVIVGR